MASPYKQGSQEELATVEICWLFQMNLLLIFFGNSPPPPHPHKPKFNDAYLLFINTLIFAPECWNCTLRGPDFKIFPGGKPLDRSSLGTHSIQVQFNACKSQGAFFPVLCPLQSFCHLLKILWKTLYKALKFGQNIFLSISHMKYRINPILAEAFFLYTYSSSFISKILDVLY